MRVGRLPMRRAAALSPASAPFPSQLGITSPATAGTPALIHRTARGFDDGVQAAQDQRRACTHLRVAPGRVATAKTTGAVNSATSASTSSARCRLRLPRCRPVIRVTLCLESATPPGGGRRGGVLRQLQHRRIYLAPRASQGAGRRARRAAVWSLARAPARAVRSPGPAAAGNRNSRGDRRRLRLG